MPAANPYRATKAAQRAAMTITPPPPYRAYEPGSVNGEAYRLAKITEQIATVKTAVRWLRVLDAPAAAARLADTLKSLEGAERHARRRLFCAREQRPIGRQIIPCS